MEYRNLGSSGLRVSKLCLGTMNFGGPTDEQTAGEITRAFVDGGGTFIDTADVYHQGRSEEIVGQCLKGIRERVVLATKVNRRVGEGPNDAGNSRKHILDAFHNSLRRLQTDYIDLYWIHRPDPLTPIEETLETLDLLMRRGEVRYVGCSTFPAWQTVEALWTSERRNLIRFAAEQPPFSILERRAETRIFPMCARHGLGIVPWSPLAGGWLAGTYRPDGGSPTESRATQWTESRLFKTEDDWAMKRFKVVEELRPMADELGISLAVLSTAWVAGHPTVTAPIIGPRTRKHVEDILQAAEVVVPQEMRDQIDQLVPPGRSLWFTDDPQLDLRGEHESTI